MLINRTAAISSIHSVHQAGNVTCRKREENEVILFVDAFDVMFVPCGRDLLEEWKAMDADLVFQADDFSWPDVDDNVKNALFPDPPRDAHPSFR